MKKAIYIILISCLIIFSSCLGVSAEISLNADNSGTIVLEYRISRLLETLGAQDGNINWLPVPIGRADFERSLQRLPGIRMLSFNSKRDSSDLINTVKLQFSDMDSLLFFLDPGGQKASFESGAGVNRLVLQLTDERNLEQDEAFAGLIRSVSQAYSVYISLEITPRGKKTDFLMPVNDLLSASAPIILEFQW